MTQRCELTELLVSDCAHCRGLSDLDPEQVPAAGGTGELGPLFFANYPGRCSDCREPILTGDQIRADGAGGYLGECCGGTE